MANSWRGYKFNTRPLTCLVIPTVVCIVMLYCYIWSASLTNQSSRLTVDVIADYKKFIPDWSSTLHSNNNNRPINFTHYSNNITGFPYPIVPDIVHLIKFRQQEIDFVEMVNIRSIVDHHKPARILIHCSDCVNDTIKGKYWDMLGDRYRSVIEVVKTEEPKVIFGKNISNVHHASDVARIYILMKYGGLFLDSDIYVVKGLHGFRHYEMALGWDQDQFLGTQVLFAHKDARFLRYWLDSYHNYQGDKWYFNAGEYPTTSVLHKRPELVHRVKLLFGVHMLIHNLYKTYWPEWTNQYTIHLLIHHRSYLDKDSPIKTFDEYNIKTYNSTFGHMARMVLNEETD